MVRIVLLISAVCLGLVSCVTPPPAPLTALKLSPTALVLDESSGPVHGLAWSNDGRQLASAGWSEVKWWAPENQHSVATWKGHDSYVWATALSPDGTRLATVGSDGKLLVRDAATGAPTATFDPVSDTELWALAWSPDGTRLAVGTDHWEVLIYSSQGGEPTHLFGYGSSVQSLSWSPNGKWLAVGDLNGVVGLWDTKTWERGRQMTVESTRLNINTYALAWSPDGKWLASGHDDGVVRLWSPDRDTVVSQMPMTGPVRCVAWSPDGQWLAAGGQGLALWDRRSAEAAFTLPSPDTVWSVAWSPDGTWLAAGNGVDLTRNRGQVLLWSVQR